MSDFQSWTLKSLQNLTGWPSEDLQPLVQLFTDSKSSDEDIESTIVGILDDSPDTKAFVEELRKRRKPKPVKEFPALKPSEFTLNPAIKIVDKRQEKMDKAKLRKEVFQPPEPVKVQKKKEKPKDSVVFVNHSRKPCSCLATKHALFTNCLSCGRILCEKEGPGPCFTCDNLVESRQQQLQLLQSRTKQQLTKQVEIKNQKAHVPMRYSTKLAPNLNNPREEAYFPDLENQPKVKTEVADAQLSHAVAQVQTLLEYDRTSAQRTKVYDTASDFHQAAHDKWSTPEQRAEALKQIQKRKDEEEKRKRQVLVSFEMQGGKVVAVEQKPPKLEDKPNDEKAIKEVSTGEFKNSPLIESKAAPKFISVKAKPLEATRAHSWTLVEKMREEKVEVKPIPVEKSKNRIQDLGEFEYL